jgi:hypothetical protein
MQPDISACHAYDSIALLAILVKDLALMEGAVGFTVGGGALYIRPHVIALVFEGVNLQVAWAAE